MPQTEKPERLRKTEVEKRRCASVKHLFKIQGVLDERWEVNKRFWVISQ